MRLYRPVSTAFVPPPPGSPWTAEAVEAASHAAIALPRHLRDLWTAEIITWPATHLPNHPDEQSAIYMRLKVRLYGLNAAEVCRARGIPRATYERRWRAGFGFIAAALNEAEGRSGDRPTLDSEKTATGSVQL